MSYYGKSTEVYALMQELSHKTRAFIKNASGLRGFLVNFSIDEELREASDNGELEKFTKYQNVNI